MPYKMFQGDKNAARPPGGSLVETRSLKGLKSAIVPLRSPNELLRASRDLRLFAYVSHQTRFDTRSKTRRLIKLGIKGRRRTRTSRGSNPADLCCSSAYLVQCEPDEPGVYVRPPSSFREQVAYRPF